MKNEGNEKKMWISIIPIYEFIITNTINSKNFNKAELKGRSYV